MSIENSVARDDRFALLLDAPHEVGDGRPRKAVALYDDDAAGYATNRNERKSAAARLDASGRKLFVTRCEPS
jgi:hypothetical protein